MWKGKLFLPCRIKIFKPSISKLHPVEDFRFLVKEDRHSMTKIFLPQKRYPDLERLTRLRKKISKLGNWVLQPKIHPVFQHDLFFIFKQAIFTRLQPKQTLLVRAKLYIPLTLIVPPTYRTTCWSNWRKLGWTNGTWWSFIKIQNGLLSKKGSPLGRKKIKL